MLLRRFQRPLAAAIAVAALFVAGTGTPPSGAVNARSGRSVEAATAAGVGGLDPDRLARLTAYFDQVLERTFCRAT